MLRSFEEVPAIRAIENRSGNPMLHEKHIRTFQSLPWPVNVLTRHSAWLMSSLVLGCNRRLSDAGSVIPDLQVALWRAVQANDRAPAGVVKGRVYPLAQAFARPSSPCKPHEGMSRPAGTAGEGGRASAAYEAERR